MEEALAEGEGEEVEEDAVDDEVHSGGLALIDGGEVALEHAVAEGAEAAELEAADVSAGIGEGAVSVMGGEGEVERG